MGNTVNGVGIDDVVSGDTSDVAGVEEEVGENGGLTDEVSGALGEEVSTMVSEDNINLPGEEAEVSITEDMGAYDPQNTGLSIQPNMEEPATDFLQEEEDIITKSEEALGIIAEEDPFEELNFATSQATPSQNLNPISPTPENTNIYEDSYQPPQIQIPQPEETLSDPDIIDQTTPISNHHKRKSTIGSYDLEEPTLLTEDLQPSLKRSRTEPNEIIEEEPSLLTEDIQSLKRVTELTDENPQNMDSNVTEDADEDYLDIGLQE